MKTKSIIFALLLMSNFVIGQENYLWPVEGKKAGENILYKPQSYIGKDLNANNLIIAAPLNTNILSPVDGTITIFNYVMRSAINHSIMYRETPTDFYQDSLHFVEGGENDVQFINLRVGIQTSDRAVV